jgi:hypothetical protein
MKDRYFRLQIIGPYFGMLKALVDIELSAAEAAVLSIVLENAVTMMTEPDKRAEFEQSVKALNTALKGSGANVG